MSETLADELVGEVLVTTTWPIPKPEIKAYGAVTYRCASCGGPTTEPVFVPPLPLTAETRTFHKEHAPNGR